MPQLSTRCQTGKRNTKQCGETSRSHCGDLQKRVPSVRVLVFLPAIQVELVLSWYIFPCTISYISSWLCLILS